MDAKPLESPYDDPLHYLRAVLDGKIRTGQHVVSGHKHHCDRDSGCGPAISAIRENGSLASSALSSNQMSESQTKPEVVLNETAHRFEMRDGDDIAVLEYRLRGRNQLVLVHTGVPHRLEGKGVAGLLARTALEHAREHQMRVVPLCSFVQAYLTTTPRIHGSR